MSASIADQDAKAFLAALAAEDGWLVYAWVTTPASAAICCVVGRLSQALAAELNLEVNSSSPIHLAARL